MNLCCDGAQRTHTRRALSGRACRSEELLHNLHAAYAVSCSLSRSILSNDSPMARVLFLSPSASPCSNSTVRVRVLTTLDIRSTEACADLKECCTPRLHRVHVKRIACSNGPTSAYNPQTRGRRVRMDFVDDLIMPDPYSQSNDEYRGSV